MYFIIAVVSILLQHTETLRRRFNSHYFPTDLSDRRLHLMVADVAMKFWVGASI